MRALNFKKCPHNSNQRKGLSVCRQSIKGYLRLKYVLDNKIEMAEHIVCVLKMTNEARSIPLHFLTLKRGWSRFSLYLFERIIIIFIICSYANMFYRTWKNTEMKGNAITDFCMIFSGD